MIDGISLLGLTPAGLLLVAVLMVLTGRLIPRWTYQAKAKEADQWHAAYLVAEAARTTSESQTRELLELAKMSTAFMAAVAETNEQKKLESSGGA
jgi:hypothetical protein